MSDTTIATNRKAFRDFQIEDSFEVGIVLHGSEVKSLREKNVSLNDSFARLENDSVVLYNCHIAPYDKKDGFDKTEPIRPRKLLLHKREITRLSTKVMQRGFSLVPLKMYFNKRGFAKIQLALGRGKKTYDRRRDVKNRELKRGLRRIAASRR